MSWKPGKFISKFLEQTAYESPAKREMLTFMEETLKKYSEQIGVPPPTIGWTKMRVPAYVISEQKIEIPEDWIEFWEADKEATKTLLTYFLLHEYRHHQQHLEGKPCRGFLAERDANLFCKKLTGLSTRDVWNLYWKLTVKSFTR